MIFVFLLFFFLSNPNALGQDVKRPNVAGLFYPKERKALEEMIENLLMQAGNKKTKGKIIGLISPHAGYEYSGNVAAYGFTEIRGLPYKTVFIFGPSHHFPLKGASIIPSGFFETPLGRVEIDVQFAKRIMERCKFVKHIPLAFEKEHSLEVQIPFLQRTLKDFRIVPIVMGDMTLEEHMLIASVLDDIYEKNEGQVLSIFSTDLSHFHSCETARRIDTETVNLIEKSDIRALIEGLRSGKVEMCGFHPVILSLILSDMRICEIVPLKYGTSADSGGPKDRVVGYLSASITEPAEKPELTWSEKKLLLKIARTTLTEYVKKRNRPKFNVKEARLNEKEPVFVTLTKKGELRGCMGHTKPLFPLFQAVCEMTINASCYDPRFNPVLEEELKDIEIEISVLGPFKRLRNPEEIEIGKHGLCTVIGNHRGLLLPQVAQKFKWEKTEFLRQTCLKAGLEPNAYLHKEAKVYFFKAYSFSEGNLR